MLCLLLLMSACTQTCVSPEQCGKLCGTRGVLLFNSQNDGMCVCNPAPSPTIVPAPILRVSPGDS